MTERLRDEDPCPEGPYEGTEMGFVPASYLQFWRQQDDCPLEVKAYCDWANSALEAEMAHGGLRTW